MLVRCTLSGVHRTSIIAVLMAYHTSLFSSHAHVRLWGTPTCPLYTMTLERLQALPCYFMSEGRRASYPIGVTS